MRSNIDSIPEYARYIRESGDLLLSMVERLLDLSAIEDGRYTINPSFFSFADVVRRCEMTVDKNLTDKNLTLEVQSSKELPPLWGDQDAISQVLINLLTNAIKFTENGRIILHLDIDQSCFSFTVEDTGVGIPPEIVDALNRPTVELRKLLPRSQGRTEGNSPGWGLGIFISREIVELHNGTMKLESKLGVGTRATVKFPMSPQNAPAQ